MNRCVTYLQRILTYVDVFDMFWTTAECTERVSNLQLPYNGVLAAFRERESEDEREGKREGVGDNGSFLSSRPRPRPRDFLAAFFKVFFGMTVMLRR